ncbi:MAG: hypothetical protein ACRDT4_18495 [Micromonosporaceae bacterium]
MIGDPTTDPQRRPGASQPQEPGADPGAQPDGPPTVGGGERSRGNVYHNGQLHRWDDDQQRWQTVAAEDGGARTPDEPSAGSGPRAGRPRAEPTEWTTQAEHDLRASARNPYKIRPIDTEADHENDVYEVEFADGTRGVYKPVSGERQREYRYDQYKPATLADREVAASRLDEMLGFHVVPTTTYWDGPYGVGSLQRYVEHTQPLDPAEYDPIDQQKMAVLDQILMNNDRFVDNYLTGPDGRPVAIDHGLILSNNNRDGAASSDFVQDWVEWEGNRPLSEEVMEQVRSVDPRGLQRMLEAAGLDAQTVDAAVRRLRQVQDTGMISE